MAMEHTRTTQFLRQKKLRRASITPKTNEMYMQELLKEKLQQSRSSSVQEVKKQKQRPKKNVRFNLDCEQTCDSVSTKPYQKEEEEEPLWLQHDEKVAIKKSAIKFGSKVRRKYNVEYAFCTLIRSLSDENTTTEKKMSETQEKNVMDELEKWCENEYGLRGIENIAFCKLQFIRQMQKKQVINSVLEEQRRYRRRQSRRSSINSQYNDYDEGANIVDSLCKISCQHSR